MTDFSAPLQSCLQGMEAAIGRVNAAGRQIAQAAGSDSGDGVDLSSAAVSLLEGRAAFAANGKVAKTVNEMNRRLIDVLG